MTTATTARGIRGIKCPSCGELNTLAVHVLDGKIECMDCNDLFTPDELEQQARKLATPPAWARTLPVYSEEEEE